MKTSLNGDGVSFGPIVFLAVCQIVMWLVIARWAIDAAVEIARIIWG